jgi:hypothetical protein
MLYGDVKIVIINLAAKYVCHQITQSQVIQQNVNVINNIFYLVLIVITVLK